MVKSEESATMTLAERFEFSNDLNFEHVEHTCTFAVISLYHELLIFISALLVFCSMIRTVGINGSNVLCTLHSGTGKAT